MAAVARVRHKVTTLAGQLAYVTRGSRHSGILAAIAAIGRGRMHLDSALNHLLVADERLKNYLATITGSNATAPQLPVGTTPPPGSSVGTTSVPGPPVTPEPVGSGWIRPEVVPDEVRAAARRFLPRPEGVNRPTAGTFRGAHLESGGRDKSIADDLEYDPLRGPPVTFYQHVESKAAAQMRRDGIATADLVVDNTVCGTNQRDREHEWSCAAILPAILPLNARLTVWVTRNSGQTWWRATYTGTGERIRS